MDISGASNRTGGVNMTTRTLSLGASLVAALLLIGCASSEPGKTRSRDIQLIRAAERGQTKEMFRLIKAGADINAQDAEGWTPYLAASSMGHFEAMRMLKAFGARTEAPEFEEPLTNR